jgi:hypothetical protein
MTLVVDVLQGASGKMSDLNQKYKEAEQQRQQGRLPSCHSTGS